MTTRRTQQVSFRAKRPEYDHIAEAAKVEELTVADFVRKLVRLVLKEYEVEGSLHALRVRVTTDGGLWPGHGENPKRCKSASRK